MTKVIRFPLIDDPASPTHPRGTPADPWLLSRLRGETIAFLREQLDNVVPLLAWVDAAYLEAQKTGKPHKGIRKQFDELYLETQELRHCLAEAEHANRWTAAQRWLQKQHRRHQEKNGQRAAQFFRYANLCTVFQSGMMEDVPLIDHPPDHPESA